jgi:streptogramin lyase
MTLCLRLSARSLVGKPLRIAAALTALPIASTSNLSAAEPTPLYRWTTLAGRATTGFDDGSAADARFNDPHGVAIDSSGNLYVADHANHTVRKISPHGVVTTLAGSPGQAGHADGAGAAARFTFPKGVAVDPQGNTYVADTGNHTVRKITPEGVVTTLAGLAGASGSTDGIGSAARFSFPTTIFADASGHVYITDQGIRRISPNGTVETINLTGAITTADGAEVTVTSAGASAVDSQGQIYFVARPLQSDGPSARLSAS